MGFFIDQSEEIKTASSVALGDICSGNIQHFFPKLLQTIHDRPEQRFLLLNALKEVIIDCMRPCNLNVFRF